jgi:outer membrane protein assembly factor BamD
MKTKLFIRFFLPMVLLSTILFSCSEFNKALKEKDVDKKYAKAVEYYNAEEYHKSMALFEELIGLTRGTSRAEDTYYYYAMCHFYVKDYYLGNYYLNSFCKTFATSTKAESCLFNAAYCSYKLSPEFSLDQQDTKSAVDQFQLFLDTYPKSALRDSANHMIDFMNSKVERKTYENARLYYQTEKYKAAVTALTKFLQEYPGSSHAEEGRFLIVKSYFLFAEGSIEEKKLERYRSASESYLTFATAFPQSKWLDEAESYHKRSLKEIDKLTAGKK